MIQSVKHPLEPLTKREIEIAVDVLKKEKALGASARFVSVMLSEPKKEDVLNFNPSQSFTREAFIVILNNVENACYEAVVSITEMRVISWNHIPGVQPTIMLDEQIECEEAVKSSAEFQEALQKRGITDSSLVMVDLWSAGNFGSDEENNI